MLEFENSASLLTLRWKAPAFWPLPQLPPE